MAEYKPTIWKDEIVDASGNLVQAGTTLSAVNLNKLEAGIVEKDRKVEEITTQLAQTATKDELLSKRDYKAPITMNDLHTDVKMAMTGDAIPVVDINSVGEENIKRFAVTEEKLSFTPIKGEKSKNLFDKSKITDFRKYINPSTGAILSDGDSTATVGDWIPVKPNTKYTISKHFILAWYNAEKVFISGIGTSAGVGQPITATSPSVGYYMRVTLYQSYLNTLQIEQGDSPTSYVEFDLYEMLPQAKIGNFNIHDSSISHKKISDGDRLVFLGLTRNLYNKSSNIPGYYIAPESGSALANSAYSASDFIAISGNTTYTLKHYDLLAFYDSKRTYISGMNYSNGTINTTKSISSPANAAFIRLSVANAYINRQQFEKGDQSTEYVEYGTTLPLSYFDSITRRNLNNLNAMPPYKSLNYIASSLMKKPGVKIKLIGDSITHGANGTGFAQDGEVIYGNFRVNTSGYCWANLLKGYLESKFTCTVKNFGTNGNTSSGILANISSLVKSDDDIVICMIGTNNRHSTVTNPLNALYNDLIGIGNYVGSLGKEIIFMSSIPASVYNETEEHTRYFHMEDVDTAVMSAATYFNTEYISIYKEFIRYCELKNVQIDSLLSDGLHPNDAGYLIMFNIISDKIGVGRKRPGATW